MRLTCLLSRFFAFLALCVAGIGTSRSTFARSPQPAETERTTSIGWFLWAGFELHTRDPGWHFPDEVASWTIDDAFSRTGPTTIQTDFLRHRNFPSLQVAAYQRLGLTCKGAGARPAARAPKPFLLGAKPRSHSAGKVTRFCLDTTSAAIVVDVVHPQQPMGDAEEAAVTRLLGDIGTSVARQERESLPFPVKRPTPTLTHGVSHWTSDFKQDSWTFDLTGNDPLSFLVLSSPGLECAQQLDTMTRLNATGRRVELRVPADLPISKHAYRYAVDDHTLTMVCVETIWGGVAAHIMIKDTEMWRLEAPNLMQHVLKMIARVAATVEPAPLEIQAGEARLRVQPPRDGSFWMKPKGFDNALILQRPTANVVILSELLGPAKGCFNRQNQTLPAGARWTESPRWWPGEFPEQELIRSQGESGQPGVIACLMVDGIAWKFVIVLSPDLDRPEIAAHVQAMLREIAKAARAWATQTRTATAQPREPARPPARHVPTPPVRTAQPVPAQPRPPAARTPAPQRPQPPARPHPDSDEIDLFDELPDDEALDEEELAFEDGGTRRDLRSRHDGPSESLTGLGKPGGIHVALGGAYALQTGASEGGVGAVADVEYRRLHSHDGFGWMTGLGGAVGGIADYGGLFELRASAGAGWKSGVFALSIGVGGLVGGVGLLEPDSPVLDTPAAFAWTAEAWLHLNFSPVRIDIFGMEMSREERRLGTRLTFGDAYAGPTYALGFTWHRFQGGGLADGSLYLGSFGLTFH